MVECALWGDPAFVELSTESRLLFIWSWTNPKAAICGLYHASEKQMERAIGHSIHDVPSEAGALEHALGELRRKPLLKYDHDNEVLWVVNRARHANRSPKVARAMQREVEDCPPSPLVEEFVNTYGRMLDLRLRED